MLKLLNLSPFNSHFCMLKFNIKLFVHSPPPKKIDRGTFVAISS